MKESYRRCGIWKDKYGNKMKGRNGDLKRDDERYWNRKYGWKNKK